MNVNSPIETDDEDDTESGAERALAVMIDIRHMTPKQFAQLGVKQLAYVKPVVFEGSPGFAIHAADGTPMAVAPELAVAIGAIRQYEMLPALVH
jgi:hypothetical protein